MDQESSRWGSVAVGLMAIATAFLAATAAGAFQVAAEFGIGGSNELNAVGRKFLEVALSVSLFAYLVAWPFFFYVLFRGPRWRKQDTFGLAVCVFIQTFFVVLAAVAIVHVSFRA